MDFISLATEQHRFLRFLDEMLGTDDTNNNNNNNNINSNSNSNNAITSATSSSSGNYDYSSSYGSSSSSGIEEDPTMELQHRPIFSKNAEGELFLLATNFLLYVALVIVVILVCRIYFPELLIARNSNHTHNVHQSYRVAAPKSENDDDDDDDIYYGTDADDDDDDENDNDPANEEDPLSRKDPLARPHSKFSLEFQQESLSRKQVLQRLIFCCIMLNVTFVLWGALQVRDTIYDSGQ